MKKLSLAKREARSMNAQLNGSGDKKLVTMQADVYTGGGTGEPLMPANLMFDSVFRMFWNRKKGRDQYKQVRNIAGVSDILGSVLYLKECFFNDGFSFGEKDDKKLKTWLDKQFMPETSMGSADGQRPYDFARIVNDAWQEWLTCDNIVAFWNENSDGSLPLVIILDCELCEYKNAFGSEVLTIKVPKVTLSEAELARLKAKGMDARYLDAMKNGKDLVLDESKGEFFRVLTRAKIGKGLAAPRIGSILQQLATMELFGIGDWAGAAQMKKVCRQILKGHEIRNGPLAGQAMHFMKAKDANQIRNMLRNKDGAFDAITSFDLAFKYPFLDPKYFDANKMAGTVERIERWAGPIGTMLGDPTTVPFLIDFLAAEGRRQRALVGNFLASIFNDRSFHGENEPPSPLIPRWNAQSFVTQKMMGEFVRLGVSNGLMSPQTGREWLGLDDKTEGDRIEIARKKPLRSTPVFEQKQGQGGQAAPKGGRPTQTPGGQAAPE